MIKKAGDISAGDIILRDGKAAIVESVDIHSFGVEIKIHTERMPILLSADAEVLAADKATLEALVERVR